MCLSTQHNRNRQTFTRIGCSNAHGGSRPGTTSTSSSLGTSPKPKRGHPAVLFPPPSEDAGPTQPLSHMTQTHAANRWLCGSDQAVKSQPRVTPQTSISSVASPQRGLHRGDPRENSSDCRKHSSTQGRRKLAKTSKANFFRILEVNEKLGHTYSRKMAQSSPFFPALHQSRKPSKMTVVKWWQRVGAGLGTHPSAGPSRGLPGAYRDTTREAACVVLAQSSWCKKPCLCGPLMEVRLD